MDKINTTHIGWYLGLDEIGRYLLPIPTPLLLGPAPTGTGTIAFDTTLGSFTLLKLVSHYVNLFFSESVYTVYLGTDVFWCSECGHSR